MEAVLVDLLQDQARRNNVEVDLHSHFLDQLVSSPLDDLLLQPNTIASELAAVDQELINLCFREYTTFTSVHRCSAAVTSAFDDFDSSLTRLINAVPDLESSCRTFSSDTSEIQKARNKASIVQDHQDKLLDLLEIPQLLETCVRNGYYQEAMELALQMDNLSDKYPVPLVRDVAREVEGIIQVMMAQLLTLLREPVKLPTLVKAVGFLIRLGVEELPLIFLSSRLANFRAQVVHLERDKPEPTRFVRKYIDLFREHIYDIISQFSAIFEPSPVLIAFASQRIQDLVNLIQEYVPRINDSASLSSILVQLGYCAQSFARVGLDFSCLISQPFIDTVLSVYAQACSTSSKTLSLALRSSAKAANDLQHGEHLETVSDFPVLAVFVNAHLAALNSLRLLAPLLLLPELASLQSTSLLSASTAVLGYINGSEVEVPASPRAHLLRRNTETQLTPEGRLVKKKQSKKVLVAFAKIFKTTATELVGHLGLVYDQKIPIDRELAGRLEDLDEWLERNTENGVKESSARLQEEVSKIISESKEAVVEEEAHTANGYHLENSSVPVETASAVAEEKDMPSSAPERDLQHVDDSRRLSDPALETEPQLTLEDTSVEEISQSNIPIDEPPSNADVAPLIPPSEPAPSGPPPTVDIDSMFEPTADPDVEIAGVTETEIVLPAAVPAESPMPSETIVTSEVKADESLDSALPAVNGEVDASASVEIEDLTQEVSAESQPPAHLPEPSVPAETPNQPSELPSTESPGEPDETTNSTPAETPSRNSPEPGQPGPPGPTKSKKKKKKGKK